MSTGECGTLLTTLQKPCAVLSFLFNRCMPSHSHGGSTHAQHLVPHSHETLTSHLTPFSTNNRASMGGMVAQELALLLIPQHRLLSLSLSITCRGMQPAHGLLGPLLTPKVTRRLTSWDAGQC